MRNAILLAAATMFAFTCTGGRAAPPRLSAGMPDDAPRPRIKAPRRRSLRAAPKAK